jgi:hypothetical protein
VQAMMVNRQLHRMSIVPRVSGDDTNETGSCGNVHDDEKVDAVRVTI